MHQPNKAQSLIPTVSELTSLIKDLLEPSFSSVEVEGEISQPNQSSNGHIYFTLKDSRAQIPCVIWRSSAQRLNFKLEHGQQVIVSGDIQVYPPHGKYQLIAKNIRQSGVGALQQAFEKLKNKLMAEGLFDTALKKKLPAFPKKVGVVTSATGAALQDMISTLRQRYPMLTLQVYHASVQGAIAASEITRGIEFFSKMYDVDVLIIGRGGGSLEDLWPFNEEIVARAIHACPIPVISAVGHETDFSISDFVADIRAATPTQAISLLTPDINELRYQVDDLSTMLERRMQNRLDRSKDRVQSMARTYALHAVLEKVNSYRSRVSYSESRLTSLMHNTLQMQTQKTDMLIRKSTSQMELLFLKFQRKHEQLHNRLTLQNPNEPLERGFSRILQSGTWIKRKSEFKSGKPLQIEWKDGIQKYGDG